MIVLTFDTDYMSEEDMERFLDEFPIPGQATFFLWRPYKGISFERHETGIHPVLTEGEAWMTEIDRLLAETGCAPRVIRPHSCTYSHLLGVQLAQRGFRAISQVTCLYAEGLRAYRHPWGIWELPMYYVDSMDFTYPRNWPGMNHTPFDPLVVRRSIAGEGLYVYALHPLHIILNSSSLEQYHGIRAKIVEEKRSAFDLAFPGRGTRTFFLELADAMGLAKMASVSCSRALGLPEEN